MLPFITIGENKIPSYGLCILVGAVAAILLACLRARRTKRIQVGDVYLGAVVSVAAAAVGAKLLYILVTPHMRTHLADAFGRGDFLPTLLSGGMVFYGGFAGGVLGALLYCKLCKLSLIQFADFLLPFLPLAHAFGRLGCFAAGCCYGVPAPAPWGVRFPAHNVGNAPVGVSLFPSQLLEAGFNVCLFIFLLLFSRRERRRGVVSGLYLICYSVFRFTAEFLRYDSVRGVFAGLSTSQWISLLLMLAGAALLWGGRLAALAKSTRRSR
ncbi:MAG: prolipoprotein diacylglyceryl transferase [Oscillospiraceae bacterium]|nr:prolipoprotein diacylglyceryl transferase [Oscillospiraceae bacterium]